MSFPLPREIVLYHLVPLLDTDSIVNLCICGVVPPSKELYHSLFLENIEFDEYTDQMFEERAACHLYAIGDPDGGRLGASYGNVIHFETVCPSHSESLYRRMILPFKVRSIGATIVQVCVGQAIQMLNSKGELFVTGQWSQVRQGNHGPTEIVNDFDYYWNSNDDDNFPQEQSSLAKNRFVTQVFARRPNHNDPCEECYWLEDKRCDGLLDKLRTSPFVPSLFSEVSGAQSFFYACDENGLIWEWTRHRHPMQGVPVLLVEKDENHNAQIVPAGRSKLRVSKELKACMVPGIGIVGWWARTAAWSWNNGYPSGGRKDVCQSRVYPVPDTISGVLDYILIADYCIYVRTDGTVHIVNLWALQSRIRGERETGPIRISHKLNSYGKFKQIAGNGKDLFALVGESRTFMIGYDEEHKPQFSLVKTVDLDIASISVGPTHCLALTKKGEVYGWGKERCCNGCLGLGNYENAIKMEGVTEKSDELVVAEPLRIPMDGRIYGVFAGEDFSAFLM